MRKRLLRHLLILLVPYLPVLLARRRRPSHTVRSVASSVRVDSNRFAAVACSLIRRAVPLLPPVHRVLWHSPGLHRHRRLRLRRRRLRRRRLLFHSISPFSLHSPFSLLRFSRPPLRHLCNR